MNVLLPSSTVWAMMKSSGVEEGEADARTAARRRVMMMVACLENMMMDNMMLVAVGSKSGTRPGCLSCWSPYAFVLEDGSGRLVS